MISVQAVFDEMWYIVEYLIVDFFPFLIMCVFLENIHNHQKDRVSYILLNPIADCVYIEGLILELLVGLKRLPS